MQRSGHHRLAVRRSPRRSRGACPRSRYCTGDRKPGDPPPGAQTVSGLRDALRDDEALRAQRYAAWTLGNLGPAAAAAVPELIDALGSEDRLLAEYAAGALERIGEPAVGLLCRSLSRGDRLMRNAEPVLAAIGPAALPCLVNQVSDSPRF